MKIVNPLSVKGTKENIQTVLHVLAGGNNCDGHPYDQMVIAADYIDTLEKTGIAIIPVIDELKTLKGKIELKDERTLNQCIERLKVIAAVFYMLEKIEGEDRADTSQEKTAG
jgi:hypothetical protein